MSKREQAIHLIDNLINSSVAEFSNKGKAREMIEIELEHKPVSDFEKWLKSQQIKKKVEITYLWRNIELPYDFLVEKFKEDKGL